jgi:hypothetical protein
MSLIPDMPFFFIVSAAGLPEWKLGGRRLYDWAVFNTRTTACTKIHVDGSCTFSDFDLEITGFAINGFKIRVCDKLDVQMPADLDQYGRNNSHRAIVGWERLVKLRHHPANGR